MSPSSVKVVNAAGTFRAKLGDHVKVVDPSAGRSDFEVVFVQESAEPTKLIFFDSDLPEDVEELADEAVDLPAGAYMLVRLIDAPAKAGSP